MESVLGPALQVPEDLENHRLKIRLAPHLRGRLLPNGQLLSLNGHDLTELSDLFTTMGARLTPAVKVSEADINRLNARAIKRGGGTQADIAATFWIDVDDRNTLERVAHTLDRLNEVDMVVFSRSTIRPEPHFVQHTPQRRLPRLTPKPIPMLGPQLGRLVQDLFYNAPDEGDFTDEELPIRLIAMDVITGTLEHGGWYYLTIEDEGEWISLRSEETGSADLLPGMPGPVNYPWSDRDITDIMLTFEVSEDATVGRDFGITSTRRGLGIGGQYIVSVFDFELLRPDWRDFNPDDLPAAAPGVWETVVLTPFTGTPPGIGRYLQRQGDGTLRMYVRILTQGDVLDPYLWDLDFVNVADLFSPRP